MLVAEFDRLNTESYSRIWDIHMLFLLLQGPRISRDIIEMMMMMIVVSQFTRYLNWDFWVLISSNSTQEFKNR